MEGGSAHDLSILEKVDVEERSEGIPRKDPATGEKSGVCVHECMHACVHIVTINVCTNVCVWGGGDIVK